VIVCRLIQGFGGSAPLTNTGGTVSDVWERNASGPAMSIYGLSSTFGPPMALVISGYIAQEKGWRWLFWVYMAIFGGVWLIMMVSNHENRTNNKTNTITRQLFRKLATAQFSRERQIVCARH
jgi:MFS family permease